MLTRIFDSAVNILPDFVVSAAVAELFVHNIHTHRIRRRREGREKGAGDLFSVVQWVSANASLSVPASPFLLILSLSLSLSRSSVT